MNSFRPEHGCHEELNQGPLRAHLIPSLGVQEKCLKELGRSSPPTQIPSPLTFRTCSVPLSSTFPTLPTRTFPSSPEAHSPTFFKGSSTPTAHELDCHISEKSCLHLLSPTHSSTHCNLASNPTAPLRQLWLNLSAF